MKWLIIQHILFIFGGRILENKKFYITTPIYYSNDNPHLGHTGTTVFADVIARYKRARNFDVFFLTGTDEHGEKLALTAEKAGKEPQLFVDEMAIKWKEYWKKLNISNDEFMRTSSVGHKKVAQELLQKLFDKGDIYKGVYKGIYCVGCEEFKAEKDLVDGKCPEHRPDQVQYREEENYFFKLSEYVPTVKKYMEEAVFSVEPENKRNEMLSRLSDDIRDLSASRQTVSWGIPLPFDNSQTTYVWIEALMNYYSATRFYENKEDFWPADVHFLGKGNNWFHSVIWPALLLALDIPLPKRVYVHGYYNVEGKKMGKSLGNVISPQDLIDRYGVDGTRYLLCASMPYENDSDVSFKWFNEKFNSVLANGLGNLISRVAKLAEGLDVSSKQSDWYEKYPEIALKYDSFKLHEVTGDAEKLINEANAYLNEQTPWKKEGAEKEAILKEVIGKILTIAEVLSPIMPETSAKIAATFNKKVSPVEILFNRLKD
jgi:methionyl-tRNA synthetase